MLHLSPLLVFGLVENSILPERGDFAFLSDY
jgi:hypothetical protein